jgi:WD40 repeat protein
MSDKSDPKSYSQDFLVRLHSNITRHFDDEELRTLCFNIKVDYESLRGEGKGAKARELVALAGRNGEIPKLIAECRRQRPKMTWEKPPDVEVIPDLPLLNESSEEQRRYKRRLAAVSVSALLFLLALLVLAIISRQSSIAQQGRLDTTLSQSRALQGRLDTTLSQSRTLQGRLETTLSRILAEQASRELDQRGGSWVRAGQLAVEALALDSSNPQALETGYRTLQESAHLEAEFRHERAVHALALSPDGAYVGTGNGGGGWGEPGWGEIRVSESGSGRELWRNRLAGAVRSVTFTQDGSWVIASSDDQSIYRFETSTGRLKTRVYNRSDIRTCVLSPMGRVAAVAGMDKSLRLWDLQTGHLIFETTLLSLISTLAFSTDEAWLAVGDEDGLVSVREVTTGDLVDVNSFGRQVDQLFFSPDREWVTAIVKQQVSRDLWTEPTPDRGPVFTWRLGQQYHSSVVESDPGEPFTAYAVSANARWLLTGASSGEVSVWNTRPYTKVRGYAVPGEVGASAFSPDGEVVVFESRCGDLPRISCEGVVHVQETESGTELAQIAQESAVSLIAISSDHAEIVLAHDDGLVQIWTTVPGEQPVHRNHGASVIAADFSLDGQSVVAGGLDGVARAWKVVSPQDKRAWDTGGRVEAVAFSPDGRYVVSGGESNTLLVRDLSTDSTLKELKVEDPISALAYDASGDRLAVGSTRLSSKTSRVGLMRAGTWETIREWTFASDVSALAFSGDSDRLAVGKHDGGLTLISVDDGGILREYRQDGELLAVAFSPNNAYVVSAGTGQNGVGELRVWNSSDGTEVWRLVNAAPILSADISSDSKYLASSDRAGLVRVFEVENGREIARMPFLDPTRVVRFGPDGSRLLVASGNIVYVTWLWTDLSAELCRRLPERLSIDEWREYLPDRPYHQSCPDDP